MIKKNKTVDKKTDVITVLPRIECNYLGMTMT